MNTLFFWNRTENLFTLISNTWLYTCLVFFPCLHCVYFKVQKGKQKKIFLYTCTNYMYLEIWYLYVVINNKQKLQIVVKISCLKAGRPVSENNTSKHIIDENWQKYSYIPLPWSLHSFNTKTFTEGHYLWTVQRNKRISYINTLNIDMLLECAIFFTFRDSQTFTCTLTWSNRYTYKCTWVLHYFIVYRLSNYK